MREQKTGCTFGARDDTRSAKNAPDLRKWVWWMSVRDRHHPVQHAPDVPQADPDRNTCYAASWKFCM